MAAEGAAREHAVRRDGPPIGEPGGTGCAGWVSCRRELARRRECIPTAAHTGGAKYRAGFPGRESEVRLLPRLIHQQIQAEGELWNGGDLLGEAATGTGALRCEDGDYSGTPVPVPVPRHDSPGWNIVPASRGCRRPIYG